MWVVVDVEADGPAPGIYSMVCFGAVTVESNPQCFDGYTCPISSAWMEDALKVSGFNRAEHMEFPSPDNTMRKFDDWLCKLNRGGEPLVFVSDNLAFDWQFINYYLWRYAGRNQFGFSGRRIGDLWAGFKQNFRESSSWKSFRKTKHTHNPVDDAMGNVEALHEIHRRGMRIPGFPIEEWGKNSK
jgi:hypothetical protein